MPLIRVPFADSGDKTSVPVAAQSDGSVSYVQGYPLAYSLDPETDTGAKRIERVKMNQLFNDITTAIREIQVNGVKPFITSEENGGSPFSYGLGAVVSYNGALYQSMTANNTQLPTVTANWSLMSNQVNSVPVISANVSGDLNSVITTGIYSVTAAATNAPLPQTAELEVYQRTSGAVVQIWHSASATASVQNRHYVRTGVITGGVATGWSAWTQTTLRPVELTGSQDLNALSESGSYFGSTWTNGPVSSPAMVMVTSSGGASFIRQEFSALVTNIKYLRTFANGSWTAWKRLVTVDEFQVADNAQNGWYFLPNGHLRQYLTYSPPAGTLGQFNPKTIGGVTYYTAYFRVNLPRAFPNAQTASLVSLAGSAHDNQIAEAGMTVRNSRTVISSEGVSKTQVEVSVSYDSSYVGSAYPTFHIIAEGY